MAYVVDLFTVLLGINQFWNDTQLVCLQGMILTLQTFAKLRKDNWF